MRLSKRVNFNKTNDNNKITLKIMLTFYSKRPKQKKKAQCFLLNTLFLILLTGMFHSKNGVAQTLGINTTGALPDSSAMLDIVSPNRGLLIPRVSLTSTSDTTTILNPAISLLVYNTNAAITGGSGLGYYYYNGTLWMNFLSGTGNSLTTPLIIGGSGTTSSLTYKPTTGVGTTGADHIFKVGNNGATEAMRILNNGNVGIGVTVPIQKLHVGGGIALSGNPASARYILLNETSTGTTQFIIQAGAGSSGYGGAINTFGHSHATKPGWVTAGISVGGGTDGSATEGRFTVNNQALAGGTDVFTVLRTGNVGIGTSSPAQKLQVTGNIDVTELNNYYSLNNRSDLGLYGNGNYSLSLQAPEGISINIDANGNGTSTPFSIRENATGVSGGNALLTVLENGNVGIGIASPSAKTHITAITEQLRLGYDASNYYSTTVASTGGVTFDAVGASSAFTFNDAVSLPTASIGVTQALNDSTTKLATTAFVDRAIGGANGWGLSGNTGTTTANFLGTTDNKSLRFRTNNTQKMIIDSIGNVGIGTSSPSQLLHISSASAPFIRLTSTQSGSGAGWDIGANNSSSMFLIRDAQAGAYRMSINPAGNVGIGTTSPACKLEIDDADKTVLDLYRYNNLAINTTDAFAINKGGAISFGGTYFTGSPTLYGFGAIKGAKEDATSGLINGYLAFITSAAGIGSREWMRISSTGNIGIGTTAPTAKTQISGDFDASTINANALVIDAKLRTSTTNGLDKAGILVTPDFNTTNSNVANTYGIKIAPIQTGVYTTTNGYGLHVTAPTVTSGFLTNSYAASFNGGNVGIGTTAPPVMLTVLNSNSVKAAIAQSLTDVTTAPTTIATANYLQLGRQEFGINSYRLIQFGYNSAATTNSPAYMGFQETAQTGVTKGDLVFGTRDVTTNTQASERMRILANGNVGIGTTTPNSTLQVNGALSLPLVTPSIYNYNVTATDYTINVTIINSLITLPSAVGITGRIYFIKANGYTTTILTTSSQTIDGAAPPSIANGTGLMVQSDGSNWIKINQ